MATGSAGNVTKSANAWVSLQTFSGGVALPGLQWVNMPGGDFTTTNNNPTSSGVGISIATTSTGNIFLMGTALIANSVAADPINAAIFRSTVGIPASGTIVPAGDTNVWQYTPSKSGLGAGIPIAASLFIVDSGLTANITYYYYYTLQAVAGGTVSLNGSGMKNGTTMAAIQV